LNKFRPSANTKGDQFLLTVIGPNIPALGAVNHMVYTASRSSNYRTHHHIVVAYADVGQVCAVLVEDEVFTFKAGRGGSAAESVSYLPDSWCQGLEKVSNLAPLGAYKLKERGCWTSSTVVDWGNEPLNYLEGEVGIMENGEDEEH
jgi:hypothetical protein